MPARKPEYTDIKKAHIGAKRLAWDGTLMAQCDLKAAEHDCLTRRNDQTVRPLHEVLDYGKLSWPLGAKTG